MGSLLVLRVSDNCLDGPISKNDLQVTISSIDINFCSPSRCSWGCNAISKGELCCGKNIWRCHINTSDASCIRINIKRPVRGRCADVVDAVGSGEKFTRTGNTPRRSQRILRRASAASRGHLKHDAAASARASALATLNKQVSTKAVSDARNALHAQALRDVVARACVRARLSAASRDDGRRGRDGVGYGAGKLEVAAVNVNRVICRAGRNARRERTRGREDNRRSGGDVVAVPRYNAGAAMVMVTVAVVAPTSAAPKRRLAAARRVRMVSGAVNA